MAVWEIKATAKNIAQWYEDRFMDSSRRFVEHHRPAMGEVRTPTSAKYVAGFVPPYGAAYKHIHREVGRKNPGRNCKASLRQWRGGRVNKD